MKYGSSPEVAFDVPVGAAHLAGPTAIATVIPYPHVHPSNIPPWAVVAAAPCDPFQARFDGARRSCTTCKRCDHASNECKNRSSDIGGAAPQSNIGFSWWGSQLPPIQKSRDPANSTTVETPIQKSRDHDDFTTIGAPNHESCDPDDFITVGTPKPSSNMIGLLADPSGIADTQSMNISDHATQPNYAHPVQVQNHPNMGIQEEGQWRPTQAVMQGPIPSQNTSNPATSHWQTPNSIQSPSNEVIDGLHCSIRATQNTHLVSYNPFEVLNYVECDSNGNEKTIEAITHQRWFEDENLLDLVKTSPKIQGMEYMSSHLIATKIKNKTLPKELVYRLQCFNTAVQCNIHQIQIPANTPETLMDALEESSYFARQCLKDLSIITTQFISAHGKLPISRNTTGLIEARLNAEGALGALAQTLHSYDSLADGSTVMSNLSPHLADWPTPWLNAFERLPVPHPVEPDPPPEDLLQME